MTAQSRLHYEHFVLTGLPTLLLLPGHLWLLGRHLDADEAVVMGTGLYAANLSTTFRLRKFGMSDGLVHPIHFLVRPPFSAQDLALSLDAQLHSNAPEVFKKHSAVWHGTAATHVRSRIAPHS